MDSDAFTILSLCSGVGGLDLGVRLAQPNARTVCYVEIEAFACEVLATRMEEQALDEAPIWTDLRRFNGKPWRGTVDCITAGYPCQPFSVAGKQKGADDPRHLWPEVCRVVEEVKPSMCFFENVGGHLRLGFEQVHDDLQRLGYSVKAGLFSAKEVGATHKRERLFIMAYRESERTNGWLLKLQKVQRAAEYGASFEFERSSKTHVADCESVIGERAMSKRNRSERSEIATRSLSDKLGNTEHSRSYAPEKCQGNEADDERGRSKSRLQTSEQSEGTDILADPTSTGAGINEQRIRQRSGGNSEELADSDSARFKEQCAAESIQTSLETVEHCNSYLLFPPGPGGDWSKIPESLKPAICRVDDGMANRVDRIRACGNGVVPLAAAYAWRTLFNSIGELN